MAGIYIHIPFCKKACYYCNFHFSTTLKKKGEIIEVLCKELLLRNNFLSEPVETIYFGGGTPSLLNRSELSSILNTIFKYYNVNSDPEITIECNPDDLNRQNVKDLYDLGFNRVSLGAQSFYDHILYNLNRNHNSIDSIKSIELLQNQGLNNISVDLIFGIPNLTNNMWMESLEKLVLLSIPHISTYSLTIEPKTALDNFIKKNIYPPVNELSCTEQFKFGIRFLSQKNYIHYETSNFCKKGFISKHNSNYWLGKPYLGIGPSAHSFNGKTRYWNFSNNIVYAKNIQKDRVCLSSETLSLKDHYNEYLMTRLRTFWGVSSSEIHSRFKDKFSSVFLKKIQPHLNSKMVTNKKNQYRLTAKGKIFADKIILSLFEV